MESEVVVVAVDASKVITDYALEWAMRNVTKPWDSLFLLAVLPSQRERPDGTKSRSSHFISSLLKKWGLGHNKRSSCNRTELITGIEQDTVQKVSSSYELMMRQLFSSHKLIKVHGEVRILVNAGLGSVVSAARELGATWIILDRCLTKEGDCCLKELVCNIVLIDHSISRILRSVDPRRLSKKSNLHADQPDQTVAHMLGLAPVESDYHNSSMRPQRSLGLESPTHKPDALSSASTRKKHQLQKSSPNIASSKPHGPHMHLSSKYIDLEIGSRADSAVPPTNRKSLPLSKASTWNTDQPPRRAFGGHLAGKKKSYSGPLRASDSKRGNGFSSAQPVLFPARRSTDSPRIWKTPPTTSISKQQIPRKQETSLLLSSPSLQRTSSIRRAMSLSLKHPSTPPPLCSICKNSTPLFTTAPRKFSYTDIEEATDKFAVENFLAEGGFGSVYKGVLPDGQVIAVKQRKFLSARGASEFCAEVEVLSCAQHKNLVRLVGYCIEVEWLLVYEFVCNGSLDKHLYGQKPNEVMAWNNRMKVATGAARGLRYLHEDCRVGCIIHRDFRPNNILLTHDFEPMVGDFGLARWQADSQAAEETRVIGSFGYLAPEYTQSGLVTEKADVYAFGVVLLELLSGFKATEFIRNTGKQFASDWGLPLLKSGMIEEIIDHRLVNNYVQKEAKCMMRAAEMCLSQLPDQRPRMSQVLKILDRDLPTNMQLGQGLHIPFHPNEQAIESAPDADTAEIHSTSQNPSRKIELKWSDEEIIRMSRLLISDSCTEERKGRALDKSENLASEECRAYLQGSLAKFVKNINEQ